MLIEKLVRLFNAPLTLNPEEFKALPVVPKPNPLALLHVYVPPKGETLGDPGSAGRRY